jgi:hypothetical protein
MPEAWSVTFRIKKRVRKFSLCMLCMYNENMEVTRRQTLIVAGLVVALIGAAVAWWFFLQQLGGSKIPGIPNLPGTKACTEEAKICPDGSSVGRTGPNCEFAECPAAPFGQTVTITGTVACLPHQDAYGPITMECAFGLLTDSGNYALSDEDDDFLIDLRFNEQATITGVLSDPEITPYDIVGMIEIEAVDQTE